MAKPEFIVQGFTFKTHANALRRLFDVDEIQKVLVSVAFVNEGGVEKIEAQLSKYFAQATVFAGVGNSATSYQGLVRLHGVVGQLFTVDTHSRNKIFHPKLYLVRGAKQARLLVGSANLTVAGLSNNIEAGMRLDCDLADPADAALIEVVEKAFADSVSEYPDHIVRVQERGDLDRMLAAGRLVDEQQAVVRQNADAEVYASDNSALDNEVDSVDEEGPGPIKLKGDILRKFLKSKSARREIRASKVPEEVPEPISSSVPVSAIEVAQQDVPEPTPIHNFSRKYSYSSEGPRLRARRLREEARSRGDLWYNTGLPCKYEHYADRLVSNGKCRECNRQDCEEYNHMYR